MPHEDGYVRVMAAARMRERRSAYVTTPIPVQAARPAQRESQTLYSGTPAFSGTRAPGGSALAA
jgi:hypothetical protein